VSEVGADPYDGLGTAQIAARLGLPRVESFATVGSTLDVAHAVAAAGAPAGTLVLADEQTAGRGRGGRRWASEPGAGIWLTLVERPTDAAAIEVLSLRVGLAAAEALEPFAAGPIRLKWPNDLHVGERKLAGILCEARWREERPEWVAIGFGVNVRSPDALAAAGLDRARSRLAVLESLVPALRRAAARAGPLSVAEREAFAARDLAAGRQLVAPGEGVARGIDADGALIIDTPRGRERYRAGSLLLAPSA
jgi:BirA family transcriptional regulator, biotin operon repressor / biotin---[acetyl-CoA-carboxylase] ligase